MGLDGVNVEDEALAQETAATFSNNELKELHEQEKKPQKYN